jgi:hypothetical protein
MNQRENLIRKANQEYEMAGLASQAGDKKAAAEHTYKAKEFDRQARELEKEE